MIVLVSIIIIGLFLLIRRKWALLSNELLYITFWWWLPIILYFSTGVQWYAYNTSTYAVTYYIIAYFLLILSRKIGIKYKFVINTPKYEGGGTTDDNLTINEKRINRFLLIGLLGTLVYIVDYLNHNSITKDSRYSVLTVWGTLGSFFCPILLTVGFYLVAHSLTEEKKISIKGLLCLILYLLPNTLNSGRESLFVVFVGLLVVYSISNADKKGVKQYLQRSDLSKYILLGVVFLTIVGIMVVVSASRFGNLESTAFLLRARLPDSLKQTLDNLRITKYLAYNTISYFAQQVPYFSFVYDNYNGPYYFGLYELNILSRRLPSQSFYNGNNIISRVIDSVPTVFSHGWPTGMASLIYDFGKIGALIAIVCMGYFIGRKRSDYIRTNSIKSVVVIALFCSMSMSLIQNGVFFQYLQFGAFIWWGIIFRK